MSLKPSQGPMSARRRICLFIGLYKFRFTHTNYKLSSYSCEEWISNKVPNFFFSSFSIRVWKLHLPRLTKTINIEAIVGTKKLTLEKLGALFEARLSMGNLKRKFMNLI